MQLSCDSAPAVPTDQKFRVTASSILLSRDSTDVPQTDWRYCRCLESGFQLLIATFAHMYRCTPDVFIPHDRICCEPSISRSSSSSNELVALELVKSTCSLLLLLLLLLFTKVASPDHVQAEKGICYRLQRRSCAE